MEALKAVIANKRKTIEDGAANSRHTKYMRRGQIERLREEQEERIRQEKVIQVDEEESSAKAIKVSSEFRTCGTLMFISSRLYPNHGVTLHQ